MKRLALLLALAVPLAAQTTRMASDYEIREMQAQVAGANDFSSQVSGHLNLGDLRVTRNEKELAMQEYSTARAAAEKERMQSRRESQLEKYAVATLFAALAEAKMGHEVPAFELAEDGIRFGQDSSQLWNVYSSTMSAMHKSGKAIAAARNAIELEKDPINLEIDRLSLALSLDENHESAEAIKELEKIVASLKSSKFDSLRKQVAQSESFQEYSTVRNDVSAYVTIMIRAQQQLANLYERRGDPELARRTYREVLKTRTDDPVALGELARLTSSAEGFSEAFDANPFSMDLIDAYKEFAHNRRLDTNGTSNGAQMRRAIEQMVRGEDLAARRTLDALAMKFPNNAAITKLVREVDARSGGDFIKDLRATLTMLAQDRVTAEQRAQLDKTILTGTAIFDALPFETGTIDSIPFRFSEPIAFKGTFAAKTPLKLTYRILGATESNGASALLLEPIKVEVVK